MLEVYLPLLSSQINFRLFVTCQQSNKFKGHSESGEAMIQPKPCTLIFASAKPTAATTTTKQKNSITVTVASKTIHCRKTAEEALRTGRKYNTLAPAQTHIHTPRTYVHICIIKIYSHSYAIKSWACHIRTHATCTMDPLKLEREYKSSDMSPCVNIDSVAVPEIDSRSSLYKVLPKVIPNPWDNNRMSDYVSQQSSIYYYLSAVNLIYWIFIFTKMAHTRDYQQAQS